MASNLYNGHLPMGLCLVQGSLMQVGPLFVSLNATVAWYPTETDMCALVTQ